MSDQTKLETTQLYNYLCKYCVGKDNMQKSTEIRFTLNISGDKKLRHLVQLIRESKEYPQLIGSKSGQSGGFYICVSEEEISETINNLKHRANQMLRMCHIMEWKAGETK